MLCLQSKEKNILGRGAEKRRQAGSGSSPGTGRVFICPAELCDFSFRLCWNRPEQRQGKAVGPRWSGLAVLRSLERWARVVPFKKDTPSNNCCPEGLWQNYEVNVSFHTSPSSACTSRSEIRPSVCLRLVLAPSAHSHDGCPLQNQTAEVTHKVPQV